MTITEAMRERRSVRSFDGNEVSEEAVQQILAFAEKTENPYGLPIEWKILSVRKDGLKSPVITGTDCFIAGKMKKVPHAEEAFGYAFEEVVLRAWQQGIGTTWIAGTMDRPAFEKAVGLGPDEVMPCVSPLGRAAAKMSLRESLMRKGVKADWRYDFGELFFKESFGTALTEEEAGALAGPLQMVRLAPSAVNKQPWRAVVCGNRVHFYEKHGKGYVTDGWDIQKIDMGIALCHFALAAEESGRKVSFAMEDPGLAVPEETEYIATYVIED